jgi:hypothetical protein
MQFHCFVKLDMAVDALTAIQPEPVQTALVHQNANQASSKPLCWQS